MHAKLLLTTHDNMKNQVLIYPIHGRLDDVLPDPLLEVQMHPGVAFINVSPLTMN